MTVTSYHRFDNIERQLTDASVGRHSIFVDKGFTEELSDCLDALLCQGRETTKILSLDIFDTLLLRDNSSEITRFFEVGGQMATLASDAIKSAVPQVDAFMARMLGTKATYRASRVVKGCREGSLTELHRTASRLLTGHDDLTGSFIAAELANEKRRLTVNPFLASYIKRHRDQGGRVILITDMYMHADQVAELLAMFELTANDYDALLSSADTKVSKSSGGIFELAEQELEAEGHEFVHLGDSFRGDVARPLAKGWQALHLPIANADILERRQDHVTTAAMLKSDYGIELDISMPS